MKSIALSLSLLIFSFGVFAQKADSKSEKFFKNPVFTPDLADPTVIKTTDGWFYAYGTENTWTDGIHHIVPVVKSKDMLHWEYVADAFKSRPAWKQNGGIWAPDVNVVNGKYYMYYSYSTWGDPNPGIGLAIADKPEGPFVDHGKIFDSKSIGVENSIDPCFVQVNKKNELRSYVFWGSFHGIYGIELTDDLTKTQGEKFKIAGSAFEATYIKERNGKFYFFGSLGSCCEGARSQYRVGVAVADDIKGPYKDRDGNAVLNDWAQGTLLIAGNAADGWVGPGHNSEIIKDAAGNDYLFYHAIEVANPNLPGGATRRPLMLDRIHWVKGWPTIQGTKPGTDFQKKPRIKQ